MNRSFQNWWNDHYFHTGDSYRMLYEAYKALHAKANNVDLDYIEGLGRWLLSADADLEFMIEDIRAEASGPDWLLNPAGVSKWIKKEGTEQLLKKLGLPPTRQYRKEAEEILRKEITRSMESQRARQRTRFQRRSKALFHDNPMRGIVFEYTSGPLFYTTGRRDDDAGSFFLLAVSEYLREFCGKPHYLLAAKLLRALRDDQPSLSTQAIRLGAMVRVDKFKRNHHATWKKFLRAARDSYKNYRKRNAASKPIPASNLVIGRLISRNLKEEFPAGATMSFEAIANRLNTIQEEFFTDAPKVKTSHLINLARPLLKKDK